MRVDIFVEYCQDRGINRLRSQPLFGSIPAELRMVSFSDLLERYWSGDPMLHGALTLIAFALGVVSILLAARRRAAERAVKGSISGLANSVEELRQQAAAELGGLRRDADALQRELHTLGRELEALQQEAKVTVVPLVPPPAVGIEAKKSEIAAELAPAEAEQPAPALEAPSPALEVAIEPLAQRLKKTRQGFFQKLKGLFTSAAILDQSQVEELEAQLVSSDLGIKTVSGMIEEIRRDLAAGSVIDEAQLSEVMKRKIEAVLADPRSVAVFPQRREDGPLVVMMVGVNGVGKTTTTAKLAASWSAQGAKVLMVAADTFRAAAVEQLLEWGRRIDVPVVTGAADAKPATVVFGAMERAKQEGFDVVLIDTAGRLHTKSNLMQELEGVTNVIRRHQPSAPHETLLVVDGSTGLNAISQAREFNAAVPLSGLVVTKLDGTPKGGVVVAIKSELNIPVRYVGVGESRHDLRPFDAHEFVEALFSAEGLVEEKLSAHAETRRRRRRESA